MLTEHLNYWNGWKRVFLVLTIVSLLQTQLVAQSEVNKLNKKEKQIEKSRKEIDNRAESFEGDETDE